MTLLLIPFFEVVLYLWIYYSLLKEGTHQAERVAAAILIQVLHCPYCRGTDIIHHGMTPEGEQGYQCRERPERGRAFLLEYVYASQSPDIK